jgi:hypothetical protein
MRRGALAAVAASLLVLVLAPAAGASHDPSGEPVGEDFVTGSFSAVGFVFTIDAHSGPSGENPTGEVTVSTRFGSQTGRVTCLNVASNRATIGVDLSATGSGFFFVEDNDGASQDRFVGAPSPTGDPPSVCPVDPLNPLSPILDGDITVHDTPALPTSKDQCKNGGWRNFPGFRNQGECVAFVERRPQP